jgi:hypothetical protein
MTPVIAFFIINEFGKKLWSLATHGRAYWAKGEGIVPHDNPAHEKVLIINYGQIVR